MDSSDFVGKYKQLPGQQDLFDNYSYQRGPNNEDLNTLKEQDIWRVNRDLRGDTYPPRKEHVGYFDMQGHKVLNTDKFTIPERPKPQGTQMGFDAVEADKALESGQLNRLTMTNPQELRKHVSSGFIPTDPELHQLRQRNPRLNDYQFKMYSSSGDLDDEDAKNVVTVNHAPFTTGTKPKLPDGSMRGAPATPVKSYDIASLEWRNHPDLHPEGIGAERNYRDDRRYGKIAMVYTEPEHRGQGLAEAAFDYGTAKHDKNKVGTAPMHDANRSMLGDIFAKRVGGPLPRRAYGHETYEY